MALGSTQLLTEMSTMNISWCVGLTTLPPACVDCLEIWEPQLPGTLRACLRSAQGLLLFVSTGTHVLVKNNGPQNNNNNNAIFDLIIFT